MQQQKKIYILGALVLFIAAIFSKGYHQFDEHFQILEFAGLKLGIAPVADMPWEYYYKMRSALQPALVVFVHHIFIFAGVQNPFIIATFLRMLSAAFAFVCVYLLIKTFTKELLQDRYKKLMMLFAFFLWFAVYNEVRFSSENWAVMVLVVALCITMRPSSSIPVHFFTGILFGLAFLLRFQIGFMIIGVLLWKYFIQKEKLAGLLVILSSLFAAIAFGVLVDKWFYGEWTLSFWNYFDQNIVLDKASNFGVRPWWYYFTETFIEGLPPFSFLYIGSTVLFFFFKPKHVLTFALLPFLLIHSLVGHKEVRFAFPVIYFLPFIISTVLETVESRWNVSAFETTWMKIFMKLFWLSNALMLLIIMFRPADNVVPLYERLYAQYPEKTELYYNMENPYLRVLNIHYYKRENLNLVRIDSVGQIPASTKVHQLYATMDKNSAAGFSRPHKLIYSGLPDWVRKFNFNNWMARTKIWYVYELD